MSASDVGSAPPGSDTEAASRQAFAALRHRDFALFSIGTIISSLGTWAQYIGIGWAATTFTDSEILIGLAFSAQFMPSLLFSPVAGVVADRFDRRRIVVFGNLVMMVPPLIIALLVHLERATIANLIALVFVGGVAQAFTMPATTAFVPALVPPEDLQPAVALNSGLMFSTRIIGPGLGALAINLWGVAGAFAANSLSFLGVVVACALVRARPDAPVGSGEAFVAGLRAGVGYARRTPAVRWLLMFVMMASFFAMHAPLLPIITEDVLDGDVTTYAWLSAAPGVGATIGLVFVGGIRGGRARSTAIVGSTVAIGGALGVVAIARVVPLSVTALAVFGLGYFVVSSLVTTMLMEVSADEYRGRVMGLFATAAVGAVPVNSVIAGVAASVIGAPVTIGVCAATILGFVVWFLSSGRTALLHVDVVT